MFIDSGWFSIEVWKKHNIYDEVTKKQHEKKLECSVKSQIEI